MGNELSTSQYTSGKMRTKRQRRLPAVRCTEKLGLIYQFATLAATPSTKLGNTLAKPTRPSTSFA